jgi:protein phosphatase 1L
MLLVHAQADGYKKPTEDRIVVKQLPDGRTALAVFDGHGGTAVSTAAAVAFDGAVENAPAGGGQPVAAWLKNWLASFDTTVRKYRNIGSTATVIIVSPLDIAGAYLGDSPAMLFSPEGALLAVTVDHHPSRPTERSRIETIGGFVEKEVGDVARVNGVLAVSRALGDFGLKPAVSSDADIFVWPRPAAGYLAIMSDGMMEKPPQGSYLKKQVAAMLATHIREQAAAAASVAVQKQEADMDFEGDNLALILMDVGASAPAQGGGRRKWATRRQPPRKKSPRRRTSKPSSP